MPPLAEGKKKVYQLKLVVNESGTKTVSPEWREGIYVGEGLSPVPLKFARRIHRGEFVEIEENCGPPMQQGGGKVTD